MTFLIRKPQNCLIFISLEMGCNNEVLETYAYVIIISERNRDYYKIGLFTTLDCDNCDIGTVHHLFMFFTSWGKWVSALWCTNWQLSNQNWTHPIFGAKENTICKGKIILVIPKIWREYWRSWYQKRMPIRKWVLLVVSWFFNVSNFPEIRWETTHEKRELLREEFYAI